MKAQVKSAAITVARALHTEEAFITAGCSALTLFLFWLFFQTYP